MERVPDRDLNPAARPVTDGQCRFLKIILAPDRARVLFTRDQRTPDRTSNRFDKPRTTGKGWGGGSWIRSSKRWAIYHQDGIECVYCGAGYTGAASLTLDHVVQGQWREQSRVQSRDRVQ